ncbi:MAG: 2-oxoacid:acceptor oxidoreductase family protein [Spirochaetaceae bacterium]|nr:MAG: 2-oxoacid:acceptor oxidoreductase family protein [Spirochaetaceae bacterium]
MMQSIFMTGLGGQGIVTLANLISGQASEKGLKVSLFNAKGMAQRGGRVTSEIRLSDDAKLDFGARISAGKADILIGMEIGETINSLSFLKEGGAAILLNYAFVPTTMILKKEPYPSFEQLTELYAGKTNTLFAVGEARQPYNMFLLGVFSAVAQAISPELSFYSKQSVEQGIGKKLKWGLEENLQTFGAGYGYGQALLQRV